MSYYDDINGEPNFPEVEEIINESIDKFQRFMRATFANEYKDIDSARELIAAQRTELIGREKIIRERERNLQEREKELAKSEEVQYEKLKTKWFTELGLAFDIGDTVYYSKEITKRVTCPTCNGTKKVKAKIESNNSALSELEICCPTCNGYGNIKGEKEFEVVEAIVIQIDARISKRQSGDIRVEYRDDFYELITSVYVCDRKNGGFHNIAGCNLYKTKEDCERSIKNELREINTLQSNARL